MSIQTMKSRLKDERVLHSLGDGPKSVREIGTVLRREVWHAWAEKHGYDFEWETDEEPLGARLLAIHEADDLGLPYLMGTDVYSRLVRLERRGLVQRIQIEGHRPMLWKAA